MKEHMLRELTEWSRNDRVKDFVRDVEERFNGTLSISKIHGNGRFFKRMIDLKSKDLKDCLLDLDCEDYDDFSLFGRGDHLSFFDHVYKFNLNGSPFMIVSQPYQIDPVGAIEVKEVCDYFGLHLYIEEGSGWYGSGSCIVIISKDKYKDGGHPSSIFNEKSMYDRLSSHFSKANDTFLPSCFHRLKMMKRNRMYSKQPTMEEVKQLEKFIKVYLRVGVEVYNYNGKFQIMIDSKHMEYFQEFWIEYVSNKEQLHDTLLSAYLSFSRSFLIFMKEKYKPINQSTQTKE